MCFCIRESPRNDTIASTFTGIGISHQIYIVQFGLITTQQIVFNKLNFSLVYRVVVFG